MADLRVVSLRCLTIAFPVTLVACIQTSLLPNPAVNALFPLAAPKTDLTQNQATLAPAENNQITAQQTIAEPIAATYRSTARMAGFSTDGRYFMQLESSRDTGAGVPKAVLQIMDLTANRCVPNGCVATTYSEADAKLSLIDAENALLKQTQQLRQSLQLTSPTSGNSVPMMARSRADERETVTMQLNGEPLLLQIQRQAVVGGGSNGSLDKPPSTFGLVATYRGKQRSLGSLGDANDLAIAYSIREVKLSADGKQVAVLLTAVKPTFEGTIATTIVRGFGI